MWCLTQGFKGSTFPTLPKSGRCQTVREAAHKLGWTTKTPSYLDIGLLIDTSRDHAHHTFFVSSVATPLPFHTIEGNTNPAGGREGYGVFGRKRGGDKLTYEYIHIPR